MNEFYEKAVSLQNVFLEIATTSAGNDQQDREFREFRQEVMQDPRMSSMVPSFVRTCATRPQFWQYIKHLYPTYKERREFIWKEFSPLLRALDDRSHVPADGVVSATIQAFDSQHIQATWAKALERRLSDPEGAITVARTLLESVCKHILDEAAVDYGRAPELNALYRLTADHLSLSPAQHSEQIFKQILGGCTTVVEGLGAIRNKHSDAHGQGRAAVKPTARHAELAVNLAGAAASFLLSTWEVRQSS